ncbi:uracil-DNA glycosylase [Thermodesulfobacteriota bacterium]
MTDNPAIIDILQETRKVLSFHRSLGIDSYPATDGIKSFLGDNPPPLPATADNTNSKAEKFTPPSARMPQKSVPPPLVSDDATLDEIRLDLGNCQRCDLKDSRSGIVFGTGPAQADLFIVGEWPDQDEDRESKPFQGDNGVLLDRMLQAIGMTREQVYLTNIVKCRPNQDLPPKDNELKACRPFLLRQIAVVKPKVILAMGALATQVLLKNKTPLSRLRGRVHTFHGIDLMPTFHPAFLIANPAMKKATWLDLQMVQKRVAATSK